MNFGLTIKKIRIEKGLTQKDVSGGIITLSYYSRIERGISEPTVTVFSKLLDRLNIGFDEFMFIHNQYEEPINAKLWSELTEFYHKGDTLSLINYQKTLSPNSIKDAFFNDIINLFLLRLTNQEIKADNTNPIIKYLMAIENWTSVEVIVFTTVMDLLPIDTLIVLVNHLLKKRNLYMKSKGYNSPYSKILINSILLCIDVNYLEEAGKYLTMYQNNLEVRDFYGHSMSIYLEGLLLYMKGHTQVGEEKICQFLSVCQTLNLNEYANKYKTYFEQISCRTLSEGSIEVSN
jgi:Rgg/GadR/MutR family transcriptional activator